jgi:hypothetical protein
MPVLEQVIDERAARGALRAQIARLEAGLAAALVETYPPVVAPAPPAPPARATTRPTSRASPSSSAPATPSPPAS